MKLPYCFTLTLFLIFWDCPSAPLAFKHHKGRDLVCLPHSYTHNTYNSAWHTVDAEYCLKNEYWGRERKGGKLISIILRLSEERNKSYICQYLNMKIFKQITKLKKIYTKHHIYTFLILLLIYTTQALSHIYPSLHLSVYIIFLDAF